MMGVVLLSILIIFITMPYHKFTTRRFPINFRQFGNVVAFSVTLVCITYVLVYGKVLDWYNDRSIRTVSFVAIISVAYSSIWRKVGIRTICYWMSSGCVPFAWGCCFTFC